MNNKITYHKVGDYYLPNLKLGESKFKNYHLSQYGRMRLNYLKQYKKAEYTIMLMNNTLQSHLIEIDETARNRIDFIVEHMAKVDGTDEELKAQEPLKWVGLMNNYKYCAEKNVFKELIYV